MRIYRVRVENRGRRTTVAADGPKDAAKKFSVERGLDDGTRVEVVDATDDVRMYEVGRRPSMVVPATTPTDSEGG